MKQKEKKLTTLQVAFELEVSPQTINNWYNWYKANKELPEDAPMLPMYHKAKNGRRYWQPSDIPKMKEFAAWVPKGRAGVMGNTNYKFWGERGIRAKENKERENKE